MEIELEKFKADIKKLSQKITEISESLTNEEQTKNALIMPFFHVLGYDIFNPQEFVPEFTADVGIKKGEKVDYAILIDGKPEILIECKSINENLEKYGSQLFRYFSTTSSKLGILTNGKDYKFYTDKDSPNKMDQKPFFEFDLVKIKDDQINELSKFHKKEFDLKNIESSASKLKYFNAVNKLLAENFENPSDNFIKFVLGEVYDKKRTNQIIEKFRPLVTRGIQSFITERVNDQLTKALRETNKPVDNSVTKSEDSDDQKNDVVTTPDELELYDVVKFILNEVCDESRIFYRDNNSYFNILIDDSNRKWVLRYYNHSNPKRIWLKNNQKFEIKTPIDLIKHKQQVIDNAKEFM